MGVVGVGEGVVEEVIVDAADVDGERDDKAVVDVREGYLVK